MAELKVDPAAVHESGVVLQKLAHTLHSELSACDQQIAASHSGWVGKSAQALAAMATEWRAATQEHHSKVADHGEKFVKAAKMYRGVDVDTADQVKASASAMGTVVADTR